ncbi:hypothetical protein OQA88_6107 [Cercophora sp. LCS_1]
MLTTVSGRALDFTEPRSILNDAWAARVLASLDYTPPQTAMDRIFYTFVVLRAKQFDTWTAEFLAANPQGATVLHLACGLDSRALRIPWQGEGRVTWIDVDVDEVVDLREKVLPDAEGDYRLVKGDVRLAEWLENVPVDKPTLIIMEGLLMYLEKAEVETLMGRVCEKFESGVILADVMGKIWLKIQGRNTAIRRTGAVMRSAVDYGKELEGCHEALKVKDEVRAWQLQGREAFPWYVRVSLWVYSWIPGLKTMSSDMRFEF